MVRKLEVYNPKKKFIEKVKPLLKPTFKIFIIFIIVILTASATKYVLEKNSSSEENNKTWSQTLIQTVYLDENQNIEGEKELEQLIESDYSTFSEDLLRSKMIADLPKEAVLRLQFYNFNSGQRVFEKSYNLKRNYVVEGEENGDIQIYLHSKYLPDFKSKGICEILKDAKNNGDFDVDTELSQTVLMWKYKSMLKYRDCLGL